MTATSTTGAHRAHRERVDSAAARTLALGGVFALTLDYTLVQGITTGTFAALVLLPLWWPAMRHFVGARVLVTLAVVSVASGLWLAAYATATHEVSPLFLRATSLTVLGGFCAVGMLLWARTLVPLRTVALVAGIGLVARLALFPPNPVNPWKHGLSYAFAVLALGLLARQRPRVAEVLVLLALAGVSAVSDSRSAMATLLLAAVLVAWQLRPTTLGRRASGAATIAVLGAVATCVYLAGTALIVEGFLGEETQQRSIEQIDASGSILLGGRPEWGASVALFRHQPWGFGTGVEATLEDISVAKSGMSGLGYDPNNGYVENYMFGDEIKLHAVVGDFWSNFGLPGLAFALVLTGVVVWSVATAIARRQASGVVLYLATLTLWNMLFGPIVTSMPSLVLALGLVLLRREHVPLEPGTARDVRPALVGTRG